MGTATALAREYPVRRGFPRYPVAVSLDVTVLRSGIPDSIPGRSVDVGQGGLGAVVAAELFPGESVGLEFRLPNISSPLQARAVVRYQRELFCGLQFSGLSPGQQRLIRRWAELEAGALDQFHSSRHAESFYRSPAAATAQVANPRTKPSRSQSRTRRFLLRILPIFAIVAVASWWHWQQGWTELETRITPKERTAQQPPLKLPPSVMEPRIMHKVEPRYPEAAQQIGLHGPVVLSAIVGVDGTVKKLQVVSGLQPLTQAAMDAVRWWRYEPYALNGQPVEVETTIAIEF